MILSEQLALLFLLISIQSGVNGSVIVKRDDNESANTGNDTRDLTFEKSLFGGPEERILEREIFQELNRLNTRKQREIFHDLEKQQERFNASQVGLVLSENENISPLNVEELKKIRKTIKTSNTTLPAIRNKRTLNFLLSALARAMGYTLTPSNPDAEWLPRQQPSPAQPCSTPPPPCTPSPPTTPAPCAMPPTAPPCRGNNALMQIPTIPPNQVDANTISYPYRPARTIPLFNFAPLPAGVRVPYPPLLQALTQQRAPCTPSPPPCGTPAPPPCGTTPAPAPPCAPSPPPCGTTPAPSPPPCGTTPAPPPPPCKPTPAPPCGTTPAPQPPPCKTTPAPPPPCAPPKPQPPPCATPAPSPPPCTTPAPPPPPCAKPAPPPSPCGTPAPQPPPCGSPPPPPPPPPSDTPKKSILLEYDDPVRIQIFSNEKKYLPASGSIYSGHESDDKDWHAYFYPSNEQNKNKDEDVEEVEEEHIEEEEDEGPGQLRQYEEEDERTMANNEEDESETNLSIVKKPADQDIQRTHKRRLVPSKTQTPSDKKKEEDTKQDSAEKTQKMKKPKRKKWIRIVKKQRRKTKTDSNPQNNFQIYTSDNIPQASNTAPTKHFEKRESHSSIESFEIEKDFSDFTSPDDSSSRSTEDVSQELKKVTISNEELNSPELSRENKQYEFNFNPFALEPEEERRRKLEKAVERYVEDYVQKQLGHELIKNTGVPKTTVFEFAPKNGPKIQTITTTVAKSSHPVHPANHKHHIKPETRPHKRPPTGNAHIVRKNIYEESSKKRGDYSYELFGDRS